MTAEKPPKKTGESSANLFDLNLEINFGYTSNLRLRDLVHKRNGMVLGYMPNKILVSLDNLN
jgi:hypothetical protein